MRMLDRVGMVVSMAAVLGLAGETLAGGGCESGLNFAAPTIYAAGEFPWDIEAADLDADGHIDLVASDSEGDAIRILWGTPGILFDDSAAPIEGLFDPRGLTIGDVNNDGSLDIVVVTQDSPFGSADGSYDVLLGDGMRGFTPLPLTLFGSVPTDVKLGDFVGDSSLDLAIVDGGFERIEILPGLGDGTFAPSSAGGNIIDFPSTTGLGSPATLVVGDIDNDGDARDFIVASDPVAFSLRAPSGKYLPSEAIGVFNRDDVALGDFDADGIADVVGVRDTSSNQLCIAFGLGGGEFDETILCLTSGDGGDRVIAVDINNDGFDDLLTTDNFNGFVNIRLSNGDRTFGPEQLFDAGTQEFGIVALDADEDGDLDLAVANNFDTVGVLENQCVVAPKVIDQPASVFALSGESVSFSVGVTGTEPLAFEWRRNGVPLSDGGGVTGSASDTLMLDGVSPGDAGVFEVFVTNASGADASDGAVLGVAADPNASCSADINADGVIDALDLGILLGQFGTVCP